MRYYKRISNGYIVTVGTGDGGSEITEDEYNTILAAIQSRPTDTQTVGHRLKTDLTWAAYPIDPEPAEDATAEDYEAALGRLGVSV